MFQLQKSGDYATASFTSKEHAALQLAAKKYRKQHSAGQRVLHQPQHAYYDVNTFVRLLRALGSDVPDEVTEEIQQFVSEPQSQSRKRKRDAPAEEFEQPLRVYEVPYHWPDHHVEYGNAMRVIKGIEQKDYPLPPVSPNIELFRLPKNHPAHGNGSSLGVRAVGNIKEGEVLCHYAGVIEPFHDNGLVNLYVMHDAVRRDVQHNALVFGNEARFINAHNGTGHAPNVAYGDFDKLGSTRGEDFVTSCQVVATRAIKVGEELLADYGDEYWKHPHFVEENKITDFEIVGSEPCSNFGACTPVNGMDELFDADPTKRDHDMHVLCKFTYNDKPCEMSLTPAQFDVAMAREHPELRRDTLVEVLRMLDGKIVKCFGFFVGFVFDAEANRACASIREYSDLSNVFDVDLKRVTVPRLPSDAGRPQVGSSVFVLGSSGRYEMATVVGVDPRAKTAQVQVLGEVDEEKLCPRIRTVKSSQIFKK